MFNLYKKFTTKYHLLIHASIGALVGLGVYYKYDQPVSWTLIVVGTAASLVPDLEHFLFFYTYGRKTNYATTVRNYIKKGDLMSASKFCAKNHKQLKSLHLHNSFSPIIFYIFAHIAFVNARFLLGSFFLSMSMHYIYDIIEDAFILGKLNSNWYLRFASEK